MANELYFKLQGRYAPADSDQIPVSIGIQEDYVTQTGTNATAATQSIPTGADEVIDFGADVIGSQGYFFVKNLDDTNYVELGIASETKCIRLQAGEWSLIKSTPGASWVAQANTAACQIQIVAYQV